MVSVDSEGAAEWQSPKRAHAVGSYEKKIAFKSIGGDGQGNATSLWIVVIRLNSYKVIMCLAPMTLCH